MKSCFEHCHRPPKNGHRPYPKHVVSSMHCVLQLVPLDNHKDKYSSMKTTPKLKKFSKGYDLRMKNVKNLRRIKLLTKKEGRTIV